MTLDSRVLAELKKMRREGLDRASVKDLMARIRATGDSVKYLGALERVTSTYRKWVNAAGNTQNKDSAGPAKEDE